MSVFRRVGIDLVTFPAFNGESMLCATMRAEWIMRIAPVTKSSDVSTAADRCAHSALRRFPPLRGMITDVPGTWRTPPLENRATESARGTRRVAADQAPVFQAAPEVAAPIAVNGRPDAAAIPPASEEMPEREAAKRRRRSEKSVGDAENESHADVSAGEYYSVELRGENRAPNRRVGAVGTRGPTSESAEKNSGAKQTILG